MEHTDERCSAKLECNVPRPAADWQCCHEAGEAGEGAGSSDRRSPGAIVGGEKKNEVAWRILDVVGVKAGVDKLVALVCFLGGSRVYFKRGGEAMFFAGPGITAMQHQAIYLLPRIQNPLSLCVCRSQRDVRAIY